ncbi:MAG: lactate utilization protein [Thermodesulfobacteriota bacterium]
MLRTQSRTVGKWHFEALGVQAVTALRKNSFDALYRPNRSAARRTVLDFIKPGQTVALAGSVTLNELDLPRLAGEKGARVITIHDPDLSAEEMVERMRAQLNSDVFLCGVNAVTLDGALVSVDSSGNRVAGMTFGPRKVVVVAGANKICLDVEAAFERVRLKAGPMNNKRIQLYKRGIELNNPCAVSGLCSDCHSETRICRVYTVWRRRPMFTDMTVILVGETLGF